MHLPLFVLDFFHIMLNVVEVAWVSYLVLDASMHLYKRLCPSVRPSVGHKVLFLLKMIKRLIHAIYIKYALFCPSFCQSIGLSIGPLVGSSAGSSTGWMHRCLPVRLVPVLLYEKTFQSNFTFKDSFNLSVYILKNPQV